MSPPDEIRPPVPRTSDSVEVTVSVEFPPRVEFGVWLETSCSVLEVVTPLTVDVTVVLSVTVSPSAAERLCESVVAIEVLSDESPELTSPSVDTAESRSRQTLRTILRQRLIWRRWRSSDRAQDASTRLIPGRFPFLPPDSR